jgi:hypothetical protein
MNRIFAIVFVAAAVGAGGAFAAGDQAPRAGACAADAARFCKDIKPGEGRIKACLAEHKKELSEACAARVERKQGGRRGEGKGWARGGGGGGACVGAYEKGFERGFNRGMKGGRGGKGGKAWTRGGGKGAGACAEDAKTLCGEVKPGEGRVKACLQQNLDKLSEGCKARQQKWLDKNKEEKKKA